MAYKLRHPYKEGGMTAYLKTIADEGAEGGYLLLHSQLRRYKTSGKKFSLLAGAGMFPITIVFPIFNAL